MTRYRVYGCGSRAGLLICLTLALLAGCKGDAPSNPGGAAGAGATAGFGGTAGALGGSAGATGTAGSAGAAGGGSTAGSGSSAGSGGAAGSGDDTTWPLPTTACGSAGLDCSTGCDATTICMVGIELCLPPSSGAVSLLCVPGSCDAATPYCIAQQCMTAEQAACVCATSTAKERDSACAGGPEAALGTCLGVEEFCDSAPWNCCAGSTCVQASGIAGQCQQLCTNDTDCPSNCCVETVAGTDKICAPPEACGGACAAQGAACGADANGQACCAGTTCIYADGVSATCAPLCAHSSECASQCCAAIQGTGEAACIDNGGVPCG
jgi:hypothetical protein